MDYTRLFYWLVVADNAKTMFIVFMTIFTVIAGIATFCYLFNSHTNSLDNQTESDKEGQRISRKWMWWSYPAMIFFWSLYIFTPSKRDSLLIVAGGGTLNFLTTDATAKQIPHELSNFVVTELKNMAKDAAVDLNIANQKDKLLEKAKKMTAEELMQEMKNDSTFAKVILDK